MSQVIENGTDLDAVVVGGVGPSSIPGHSSVTFRVVSASPVEGQADMLSSHVGEHVDISVRPADMHFAAQVGKRLRLRASMVGPGVFLARSVSDATEVHDEQDEVARDGSIPPI